MRNGVASDPPMGPTVFHSSGISSCPTVFGSAGYALVCFGALKMLDVKQTHEMSGHEIAGHENARHENVFAYITLT